MGLAPQNGIIPILAIGGLFAFLALAAIASVIASVIAWIFS